MNDMGTRLIGKPGDIYGRLTLIEPVLGKGNAWRCVCVCGGERVIGLRVLNAGLCQSCGCAYKARNVTHGKTHDSRYSCWYTMVQRCTNPSWSGYHRYGARGVKVCERWLHSIDAFCEDMGERPKGTSLDRIDNDGDYEPDNCKWATAREQGRNTCRTTFLTLNGITKSTPDWAEEYGITASCVYQRVFKYGWSPETALTTPVTRNQRVNVNV